MMQHIHQTLIASSNPELALAFNLFLGSRFFD